MPAYTVLDLFGAPGGLSYGFNMAGFELLAMVDRNPAGCETYKRNLPSAKCINMDIDRVTADVLRKAAGIRTGDVDVIIGGPPCQGYSNIGRVKISSLIRNGNGDWKKLKNYYHRIIDDPRNVLYKKFIGLVKVLKPKGVVMENVLGIQSYYNGAVVTDIQGDFRAAFRDTGCTVGCDKLRAADYGVPQMRRRTIFLVIGGSQPLVWPVKRYSDKPGVVTDYDGTEIEQKNYFTVNDALGDLPPPLVNGNGGNPGKVDYPDGNTGNEYQKMMREGSDGVYNHIMRPVSDRDARIFPLMKEGDRWADLPESEREKVGYRNDIFHDKWKRLDRSKPSWTVVAHLSKDGYMFIHPWEHRTITVREAARLQSFPDKFVFEGSRTEQYRQVGNAVPPFMAREIALAVKEMLDRSRRD